MIEVGKSVGVTASSLLGAWNCYAGFTKIHCVVVTASVMRVLRPSWGIQTRGTNWWRYSLLSFDHVSLAGSLNHMYDILVVLVGFRTKYLKLKKIHPTDEPFVSIFLFVL